MTDATEPKPNPKIKLGEVKQYPEIKIAMNSINPMFIKYGLNAKISIIDKSVVVEVIPKH